LNTEATMSPGKSGFHRRALLGSAWSLALTRANLPLLAAAASGSEKFDFDTPYNRFGTDSTKWDGQIRRYGKDSIVAGMGISDTDFRTAPAITRALAERVRHENWGYLDMPQSFLEAIVAWNRRRYGVEIHRDRMLLSTGVHPSIVSALRAFSPPGSKVLLLTPTYDGFFGDIAAAGCKPEECPLKLAGGRYQIDLETLDRHISRDTNSLILCNPNNPTGNVWSAGDLTAVGELCTRRRVVVLVDEIHCDFVTGGNKYTPYCLLGNRDVVMNSVTFKSASKAFSLSAMKCGWMYSDNADYLARIAATGHSGDINTLGVIAARAAYTEGEEYLNQLVPYIDGNHDFLESFLRRTVPLIRYAKAQGTYLAWLDVSGVVARIGAKEKAAEANRGRAATARPVTAEMIVQDYLVKEARVQINAGTNYGLAGEGHMRMNIGTSRQTLELALTNIASALGRA
jgi:cysteine-S-conjugate beta-lyase